jgi:hypothetical protein
MNFSCKGQSIRLDICFLKYSKLFKEFIRKGKSGGDTGKVTLP